ncbi:hypothetical protein EV385_6704 [Krasilnikovia cinnamomea]|uniref:Uncharacterized protein n=1 Tax=Krasilnikovia cinnamomea TaxID=349313 RepID=A0A4Q7Z855_9ACTN|nr:hypothetical protein [Krasilnikovia cinnamomea]RZU46628.1 hypothetical protein EV385_6704 [Krasilnikovia cinnamomea]
MNLKPASVPLDALLVSAPLRTPDERAVAAYGRLFNRRDWHRRYWELHAAIGASGRSIDPRRDVQPGLDRIIDLCAQHRYAPSRDDITHPLADAERSWAQRAWADRTRQMLADGDPLYFPSVGEERFDLLPWHLDSTGPLMDQGLWCIRNKWNDAQTERHALAVLHRHHNRLSGALQALRETLIGAAIAPEAERCERALTWIPDMYRFPVSYADDDDHVLHLIARVDDDADGTATFVCGTNGMQNYELRQGAWQDALAAAAAGAEPDPDEPPMTVCPDCAVHADSFPETQLRGPFALIGRDAYEEAIVHAAGQLDALLAGESAPERFRPAVDEGLIAHFRERALTDVGGTQQTLRGYCDARLRCRLPQKYLAPLQAAGPVGEVTDQDVEALLTKVYQTPMFSIEDYWLPWLYEYVCRRAGVTAPGTPKRLRRAPVSGSDDLVR